MQIDFSSLMQLALENEGVHIVGALKSSKIGEVLINGVEAKNMFFVDIDKGFGIRAKTDLSGNIVINGDDIVYEIVYGNFEVQFNGDV